MESPSSTISSNIMANPSTTYVFIVGNAAEWEKDRAEMGDKQLHHCFQQFLGSFSRNNMTFILDNNCTKAICERELKILLERTKSNDTLVFCYSGHGIKSGFCTIGKKWRYSSAINMIEEQFRGSQVWCLIDCCFSGAFDHQIPPKSTKTWLCLMSSDASIEAGEDWTMTDCFSKAMRGRLLRQEKKASKKSNEIDFLTIQDMVEIMADHHAIIKNDCLQATLHGTIIDPTAPFPYRIPDDIMIKGNPSADIIGVTALFVSSLFAGKPDVGAKKADNAVPVDTIKWKRLVSLTKGDRIYAKWSGGSPPTTTLDCPYLFPAWYHATIASDVYWDRTDTVEVEFQHDGHRWTRAVSYQHQIVPASYVEITFTDYCKAHKKLAQYGRYLDATIKPGAKIWALYLDDGVVYTAYIQQDNDREWHQIKNRVMNRAQYLAYYGPFLWGEWEGEDDWTLLPKCHCIIQEEGQQKPTIQELRQQARQPTDHTLTAKQAMLKSMETMGKQLVRQSQRQVSGYWEGSWYDAITTDKVPPLKILVQHLHFENINGDYYCVQWKSDDSLSLLPEQLVRMPSGESLS